MIDEFVRWYSVGLERFARDAVMIELRKSDLPDLNKAGVNLETDYLVASYITPARFEDEKDKWPKEAWSLVVEFNGPPDESLCTIADVRFLSPEGPTRLLHPGSVFELYEGRRMVARGEVL